MTSRRRATLIRRALPTTALALLPLLPTLVACGGATPSAESSPSVSPSASGSASGSAQWPTINPCDGLDPAPVAQALGWSLKVDKGTSTNARCALLPTKDGGPTYELNYLWFPGGLDAAWNTIQAPPGAVTRPRVKGADATRLVVYRTKKAFYVSGFVQNGSLIQSFNGLALAPYDATRMRRAALVLLGELSAGAPKDQPTPGASASASPSA